MTAHIRRELEPDFVEIRKVVAAAFEHVAEANLVEAIRASSNYVPELSLVAEVDDVIVGHVMISYGTLLTARGARPIAMLAPLAIAPAHQRRGIGGQLVTAVCHAANEEGHPLVVLEGGPKYYGKLGFEPASQYGIEMPLPDWAPPEAAQVLPLDNYDPAITGRVIYPAYFDAASAERGD